MTLGTIAPTIMTLWQLCGAHSITGKTVCSPDWYPSHQACMIQAMDLYASRHVLAHGNVIFWFCKRSLL